MSLNEETAKKIQPVHFKNLDALRFLAALSVIFFHISQEAIAVYPELETNTIAKWILTVVQKGHLGVNFFFVLSGFLITYLILHEQEQTGNFSLKKFLIRRTLRIWPLYFMVVLVGFVIFPLLIEDYHTNHHAWRYLLFIANFDEILVGATDPINFLTAPWSVAVEEQFYLFWGIALFVIFKIKQFKPVYLVILIYIISFIFRWIYWDDYRTLYFSTFTVCQDILTGTLLGMALFKKKAFLEKIRKLSKLRVFGIYLVGFAICILKNQIFAGQLIIFERSVLSIFFGFIILDQIRGEHSIFKLGKIQVFNNLGKISYGLYMYHLIVMYLLMKWMGGWFNEGYWAFIIFAIFILICVVVISTVSYRFMEKPLLKLKPK
ncbi:MAG: acyltransferase [Crocinitomicaceae bacterium]|nr:acyltransferase [Crocinitomicaceae bacterium]